MEPSFPSAMRYVDGFVIPISKKNVKAYTKMAAEAGKVWLKYGALEYIEAIGEDLKIKGITATFPKITKSKPTETVLFSFIVYKSRKHRDEVNAKVMKDPFMNDPKNMPNPMPFEMKRMTVGGFETIVDLVRKK